MLWYMEATGATSPMPSTKNATNSNLTCAAQQEGRTRMPQGPQVCVQMIDNSCCWALLVVVPVLEHYSGISAGLLLARP